MYLCINFVNIFMQNICAEMEKWVLGFFFFCISQIEATVLGNEANFTHGNLKLLRETLVNVMCESTVCLYTQAFWVLRIVYAQRTTWTWA